MADITEYEEVKQLLDESCKNWCGKYTNSMNIVIGAATPKDVESKDILEICKHADKCMYQAKSDWYKSSGLNRRTN